MTVTSQAGNGLARANQSRPRQFAGVDPIAYGKFKPCTTPQVPGGGDTATSHGGCAFSHLRVLVGIGTLRRYLVLRIQLEVHVGIDQAGNGHCPVAGDAGGILLQGCTVPHRGYLPALDTDGVRIDRDVAVPDG